MGFVSSTAIYVCRLINPFDPIKDKESLKTLIKKKKHKRELKVKSFMGISMIPNAFFLSTLSDRTLGLAERKLTWTCMVGSKAALNYPSH